MFDRLGRFVTHTWMLWLLFWAGLLAGTWWTAPEWSDVSEGGVFQFLPAEAPSRQARAMLRAAFRDDQADSSIVLVAHRTDGPLRAEDERFLIDRLVPGLEQIARERGRDPAATASGTGEENGRPEIVRIRSLAQAIARPVVLSDDNQATIVLVELSTSFLERSNRLVVAPVLDLVDRLRRDGEVPEGLALAVTGSAVVGEAINAQEAQTARTIERWTIWWVLLLLLIVHRAPVLALVQMLTVFVAMQVALNLMALMAGAGWVRVFESLNVYTTVLVYGAGIDYSLFLIARYRERLEAGASPVEAMRTAVSRVGLTVTISAATAIVAIGTLRSAEFAMFTRAGFAIPFGLFVMLLTSLTLTPSLLLLFRGAAVWPSRAGVTSQEASAPDSRLARLSRGDPLAGLWRSIGGGLKRWPGPIGTLALLAILPFASYGWQRHDEVNYGPMAEIPGEDPSAQALDAIQQHFPAGMAGPLTVVLHADTVDFSTEEGTALVDQLTDRLMQRGDELSLASVRSVAEGFGASRSRPERADEPQADGPRSRVGQAIGEWLTGAAETLLPGDPAGQAMRALRERAIVEYVGSIEQPGDTTRIILVPDYDPFGDEAIDRTEELRLALADALPEELSHARVALSGASASFRDLRDVTQADRRRITLLASLGVALVLMILLRRLFISLVLVASVLLSYLVTLGVTFLVFQALDGADFQGIDWTVPVFLFTLLMAIGADYNVFLLTRIDEEQREHGPLGGVVEGLRRTGGVISGCGLIMAGTFASLIWGGALRSLDQLGFALAFGVLLDTFFIRPLLVPSLLALIHGGRLGRFGRWLGGRGESPARDQDRNEATG